MSRIGKAPIDIPEKVSVTSKDNCVSVKGPKGDLSMEIPDQIKVSMSEGQLQVARESENNAIRARHGLVTPGIRL